MKKWSILITIVSTFLVACQQNKKSNETDNESTLSRWQQPKTIAYKISDAKRWLQDSTITYEQRAIVFAVNRTDSLNFSKMDSVILPVDLSGDLACYLPFPLKVSALKEIDKIIFFSYPTQTFGAYEKGELVYAGPTNMGRERDQTPTGLFFTNWKAKKTISTFNDEWELRWNFNIMNQEGIGWHQYELPGYPASHSCLRLLEKDAKYLYTWANQWVLADKTTVYVKGTPVIIFGSYDFKGYRPWFQLVHNPHTLDISENEIKKITEHFFPEILESQKTRKDYQLKIDAEKSAADSLI